MSRLARALLAARDYLLLAWGYGLLGAICLAWTVLAALLHPLLPRATGQVVGRRAVRLGFRFYLRALSAVGACRFDLDALEALRGQGPMIVAPNHPSLLDAVMLLSRLPDAACIMKASLMDSPLFGAGARLARYIRNEPLLGMVLRAAAELRGGGQLLLFPEGTRTGPDPVGPFRAALGVIAKRAGVPVQAVFIEADSAFLGKGWPLLRRPPVPMHYRVRLGRRFDPPADPEAFTAELQRYFAAELRTSTAPARGNAPAAAPAGGR